MGIDYFVVSIFAGVFLWAAYHVFYLQWQGIQTTGTIVELVRDESESAVIITPVVAFPTSTGATIRAKSMVGSTGIGSFYAVGQQVEIRYSAKDPTSFIITGHDAAVVFLLFLVALGVGAMFYLG